MEVKRNKISTIYFDITIMWESKYFDCEQFY